MCGLWATLSCSKYDINVLISFFKSLNNFYGERPNKNYIKSLDLTRRVNLLIRLWRGKLSFAHLRLFLFKNKEQFVNWKSKRKILIEKEIHLIKGPQIIFEQSAQIWLLDKSEFNRL